MVYVLTCTARLQGFRAQGVDGEDHTMLVEPTGVAWQLTGVAERSETLLYRLEIKVEIA